MLTSEERNRKIKSRIHVFQSLCERKHLFPPNYRMADRIEECYDAIKNPMKGVIVKDNRTDVQSQYVCIFVGTAGHIIGIPFTFSDDFLVPLTIKDLRKDFNNPNWFVDRYNEIAKTRGLQSLNYVVRDNSTNSESL